MAKFLQSVACDLKRRIGKDLSTTVVVFPNKRAALFFDRYLVEDEDNPIWSPRYLTISELFREANPALSVPDTVELVCRLYKTYCAVVGAKGGKDDDGGDAVLETLDYFYQWGETLLSDFDDIDKNMTDAHSLFRQIDDWNKMEDTGYIDEEMEQRIRQFFAGFSIDKLTKLKRRFMEMWENLDDIYTKFNEELRGDGLSYEGALYKDAAVRGLVSALPYDHFVFIGFNVLDEVEKTVFRQLAEAGKALFYWDYDDSWGENDAARFVRRNIEEFPNALPAASDSVTERPDTTVISSKTNDIQAQYARQWVADNLTHDESDTALVLCDERQLQEVMHAIPENVKALNVTMGYPLSETPAMGFVQCLAELQDSYDGTKNSFSYQSVCKLLRHPYASLVSSSASEILDRVIGQNLFYPQPEQLSTPGGKEDGDLRAIFTPQTDNLGYCNYLRNAVALVATRSDRARQGTAGDGAGDGVSDEAALFQQLYNESLFRTYTTLTRFANLVESGVLDVGRATLLKLIGRVMQGITIPFHGEPAVGLQVMGMLETRNLDFTNIIMLGVNEGMLPKNDDRPSFIPATLRRAFGMTTPDRRVAVFAYYFYRLVRRCKRLCLIYNDEVENGKKCEMSRFLLQLIADGCGRVSRYALVPQLKLRKPSAIAIPRTTETLQRLKERFACRAGEERPPVADWLGRWSGNPAKTVAMFSGDGRQYANRHILSPSAINAYLDCRLMFYYRYVARIKPMDEMRAGIDNALFGTIFHASAEEIYARLAAKGNYIDARLIDEARESLSIDDIVDFYFRKHLFKQPQLATVATLARQVAEGVECPQADYDGIQLINRAVITRLLAKLLELDANLGSFHYLGSEVNVSRRTAVTLGDGSTMAVDVGGNIDRLDYVAGLRTAQGGTVRVVDYKTGASEARAADLDSVFMPVKGRSGYHLQTLLYASIVCDMTGGKLAVAPSLLYIQKQRRDQMPVLTLGHEEITDVRTIKQEVDDNIARIVDDIFNGSDPYVQTGDEDRCQYCDFRALCGR